MGRLVPALTRGLDILELLRDQGPQPAASISKALSLPRTTVHELVKTLEVRGYLKLIGNGNLCDLGVKVFELGSSYENRLDLAQIARDGATAVGAVCGETVHVAVLDGADVVYIVRIEGTHAVQMVSAVGIRLPAHVTAVGKAMLSYQPVDKINELYPPGMSLTVMTPASLRTSEDLELQLRQIRQEGLAWDNCESNPDVYCVAAPVTDSNDSVVAAMSISVPSYRWDTARALELGKVVRAATRDISLQLGAPGHVHGLPTVARRSNLSSTSSSRRSANASAPDIETKAQRQ